MGADARSRVRDRQSDDCRDAIGRLGLEFRANNHPIELRVEDFVAAQKELESRGVEFEGDTLDSGVCHQAFFKDPDGNTLAIHHRYAAGPPPQEADKPA